jgi:hypothetical protein
MMTPGAFDSSLLQGAKHSHAEPWSTYYRGFGDLRETLSKPENLIPLLSGIAAMGTAPT